MLKKHADNLFIIRSGLAHLSIRSGNICLLFLRYFCESLKKSLKLETQSLKLESQIRAQARARPELENSKPEGLEA